MGTEAAKLISAALILSVISIPSPSLVVALPTGSGSADVARGIDLSSSLLPEFFPEGDPTDYAYPVFTQHPQDAFASKSAPAVLSCKVAHAIHVYFSCNGDKQETESEKTAMDPESGFNMTTVTVRISRAEVMDGIGAFTCQCTASSSQHSMTSNAATVSPASLRKEFETPPYSTQVELGGQAELRCHPPKGNPPAKVSHWLKNGQPIDPAVHKNFIQSASGSLLILQAQMEDMANYSCVASNDAMERTSPQALLTVSVRGQWGDWSPWSECNTKCRPGLSVRTRSCDNPVPVNNGQGCDGLAIQKKPCHVHCPPVDGAWSAWSSWSTCSPDCLQFRNRKCNDPAPRNDGIYCQGADMAKQNCSGGMCKPGFHSVGRQAEDQTSTEAAPPPAGGVAPTDLTLCIGLVVAFLIFLVVILVIMKLLRKKSEPHSGYVLTPTSTGGCDGFTSSFSSGGSGTGPMVTLSGGLFNGGGRRHPQAHTLMYASPDITSNVRESVALTSSSYEYGSPTAGKSSPGISGYGFTSDVLNPAMGIPAKYSNSEHLYEQPIVARPSSVKPYPVQPPQLRPALSLSTSSSESAERTTTPFLAMDLLDSTISSGQPSPVAHSELKRIPKKLGLPRYVNKNTVKCSTVTSGGGQIAAADVSLTVPAGAIPPNDMCDLYVGLVTDEGYRPLVGEDEIILTPVVQVGVLGSGPLPAQRLQRLLKPAVLSMGHVGGCDQENQHKLLTLHCDDLGSESPEWTPASAAAAAALRVDPTRCHLVTDQLGAFVVIANKSDVDARKVLAVQKVVNPANSSSLAGLDSNSSSSGYSSSVTSSPKTEQQVGHRCFMQPYPRMSRTTWSALCRCLDVPTCLGSDWRQLAQVVGFDSPQYIQYLAAQPSPSAALFSLWETRSDQQQLQCQQGDRRQFGVADQQVKVNSSVLNFANLLRTIDREDVAVILERELG